jgi:VIT1/CCC1 family predicted Fe2+/Mn2+ transporter
MPIHSENHLIDRIGWLRAAVLGANDGIISTASLILGVAAASPSSNQILVAGSAGMVAGAFAMAAGEYVSVSSQADTEQAELHKEREELKLQPELELDELTNIYIGRGVEPQLARQVAKQMTDKDALGTHARDELGIVEHAAARPIQAAFASAVAFAVGAALPLIIAIVVPVSLISMFVSGGSLIGLGLLGGTGAYVGGANVGWPALRVTFWGAFAMLATAAIGTLVGTTL